MGKKAFKKNSNKKGSGVPKPKKDKKRTFIPKYTYFAKAHLCSYPDEDGTPIYLGAADDEKDFFHKGSIAASYDKENCEAFHRIGMALCLYASSFEVGSKALKAKIPEEPEIISAEQAEKMSSTGLVPLVKLLNTQEGQEAQKAFEILNAGKHKKPRRDDVKTAINSSTTFLDEHGPDLRKQLSRLAIFAAKQYLFTMSLTELLDLHEHPKLWARAMQNLERLSKAEQ